jgi:hypothetical protein
VADYEFTKAHEAVINKLHNRLLSVGMAFGFYAFTYIVFVLRIADDLGNLISYGLAMQGVLAVGVAFLFVLPLNNIQRIVTTEGEDITQFRQMIRDLQTAFLGLQVSFILFIIVTIIGYFYVARQLLNLN